MISIEHITVAASIIAVNVTVRENARGTCSRQSPVFHEGWTRTEASTLFDCIAKHSQREERQTERGKEGYGLDRASRVRACLHGLISAETICRSEQLSWLRGAGRMPSTTSSEGRISGISALHVIQ